MKHATRIARRISAAIAVVLAGASSAVASPPAGAATVQTAPLATVNGIALKQASLDAALAAAGRQDTLAARREFKQRLIACELLRQAARRARREQPGEGPRVPLAVSPTGALVCSAQEIRSYVLTVVRPAAVTQAQVRARYAALAREHALPTLPCGRGRTRYAQVAACLRMRLEDERLDSAIRALADRLIDEADIVP